MATKATQSAAAEPVERTGPAPAPDAERPSGPRHEGPPPAGASGDDELDRWRLSWGTWVELPVIVAVVVGLGIMASWVADPVDDLGGSCPSVLRYEFAVSERDLPSPRPLGLQPIDPLLECTGPEHTDDVRGALESSTERDDAFIIAYTAFLAWCCLRMSGRRHLPLSRWLERLAPHVGAVERWRTAVDKGTTWLALDPAVQRSADARATYHDTMRDLRENKQREIARAQDHRTSILGYVGERLDIRRRFREGKEAAKQKRRQAVVAARTLAVAPTAEGTTPTPRPEQVTRVPMTTRVRGWLREKWRDYRHRAWTWVLDIIQGRIRLPEVAQGRRSRMIAGIALLFAVVAGLLDVIENRGLTWTAEHWGADPNTFDQFTLRVTAGAAAAKFALLALPIIVAVLFVARLVTAATGGRARVPHRGEVWLPKPGPSSEHSQPEQGAPGLDGDQHRWALPDLESSGFHVADPLRQEKPYGICLSGGGIRSATFSLGALQTLEDPAAALDPGVADADMQEKAPRWATRQADYLSAVSGGSYMAASYQFLSQGSRSAQQIEAGERAPGTVPLMPKAGRVEDHFRRSATHLADGAPEWILAIAEVLAKTLFTVAIVVLGVLAVGIPLGWVYRYVYYGVAGGEPALRVDFRILAGPVLALLLFWLLRPYARFRDLRSSEFSHRERGSGATRTGVSYLVILALLLPVLAISVNSLVYAVGSVIGVNEPAPDPADVDETLDELVAGTSAAAVGAAQAAAVAVPEDSEGSDTAAAGLRASAVAADIAAVRAQQAARALQEEARDQSVDRVDGAPPTTAADQPAPPVEIPASPEATASCPPSSFDLEEPASQDAIEMMRSARLACLAAVSAAEATQAVATNTQLLAEQPATTTTTPPTTTAGGTATTATAAAPATTTTAPPAIALTEAADKAVEGATAAAQAADTLTRQLEGEQDTRPPTFFAGLTALVAFANALYAKRRTAGAAGPKATSTTAGSNPKLTDRITETLGLGGFSQVLVGVSTAVVLIIFLSDIIVASWRVGLAFVPERVLFELPLWQWWAIAVGVLVLVTLFANFNTWSLRPFYHRRLWIPYAVTPQGSTKPWRSDTRMSIVGRRRDGFPELLVCAAAQTSGREWAPPGRRALSFVFSAEICGGPDVGYVRTSALEELLSTRRRLRQPMTLFGASTTSGAAFGPAMGRHSMGGMGAALAIANARLGAWMPNPHHLHELADAGAGHRLRAGSVSRWPRIWYWMMEIVGQYPMEAKLVLLTDGGHVENLGLVELLRRRCDRIMCFDASGAGLTPATLAEAIVLAREEVNVEIEILPTLPSAEAASDEARATNAAETAATAAANAGAPDVAPAAAAAAAAMVATKDATTPTPPTLLDVETSGADPLKRGSAKSEELAALLAKRPVLVARIHYPEVTIDGETKAKAFTGTLVYGTLAVTDDGADDWDLIEYAQRKRQFPKHGTDKQWFEADVFGAYHQLGRRTAERMVKTAIAYEDAGLI